MIISVIVVLVIVVSAAALAMYNGSDDSKYSDKPALEFDDSLGNHFVLDEPLKKVIILNRQTAMAFTILEAEELVIATGDTTTKNEPYLTAYRNLPDVGETGSPDLEKMSRCSILLHQSCRRS